MKKLFVLLLVFFTIGFTKANPIVDPPVISEFYLVNDSVWYLELMFSWPYPSLDGLQLVSSGGSSFIKHGISITAGNIIVLTHDSMLSPLHFNRNGDFVDIQDSTGFSFNYSFPMFRFGNISNSFISAPLVGQSIVCYKFYCMDQGYIPETEYHLVKDVNPTIGYNAFTPSFATGTFTGMVFDNGHNPIQGIHIGHTYAYNEPSYYCGNYFLNAWTQPSGSFTMQEYSGKYHVMFFFHPWLVIKDTIINIEPDSVNYFEFIIDSLLTDVHSIENQRNIKLSCFPNPSTGETNISFGVPEGQCFSKALIKIYGSNGEIVRILPVNTASPQPEYTLKWDGFCCDHSPAASGMYYCNLVLDGRKSATTKLIIER
ncbi:MAG: hypothetical protein NTU44_18045 [Bacteroidetes bacterium]|nr:hypothetical protein [Bacteroidota bacterium]